MPGSALTVRSESSAVLCARPCTSKLPQAFEFGLGIHEVRRASGAEQCQGFCSACKVCASDGESRCKTPFNK
jgi:hypothetical protein